MDNVKELIKLINEHPDYKVIPLVDSDVVLDDSYYKWFGSIGASYLDKYTCLNIYDEELFLNDKEEILDQLYDYYDEKMEKMTEEEGDKFIEDKYKELKWVDVIVVNINACDPDDFKGE